MAKQHPGLGHDALVDLVEALWIEPVHERRMVAVELLDLYVDRLRPEDAELLEHLRCKSRTWALVDGLAASVVGRLVERYDEMGTALDRWAGDDDSWLRRSAIKPMSVRQFSPPDHEVAKRPQSRWRRERRRGRW